MTHAGLEAKFWKAAATCPSVDAATRGIEESLQSLTQSGSTRVRLSWKGRDDSPEPTALTAWLGDRAWRWAADWDAATMGSDWRSTPSGGLLVQRLDVDGGVHAVAVIVDIGERHAEAVASLLAEVLATVVSNELRKHAGAESAMPGSSARVRRSSGGEAIVGATVGLAPVLRRVEMVAPQDVPVLLLGETGSGKEVIARAVHDRSRRAGGPFVRVNCGAIPRDLIDSELFGHEKGSFTGASDRRHGWFERSHGGTLLLDEIGELPLDAQVRLLRILQDGSFTRVGGATPVSVDVRIVGATHRDLPTMVDQRTFREDLWYRIATFPIRIPPLRERQEDIPELARHFVRKASVRFGLAEPRLDEHSLAVLQGYAWPGNVRELGAVIDRAMILGEGHRLEVAQALGLGEHESEHSHHRVDSKEPEARLTVAPSTAARDTPATLSDAMKRHIEAELRRCFGRVEGPFGAARALGINPHTLRSRMKKLGVDWSRYKAPKSP